MAARIPGAVLAPVLALLAPAAALADELTSLHLHDFDQERNRGRITLGFQNVHTDGGLDGAGNPGPGAQTDTYSMMLGLDYRFADRWMAHAAIPFIRKRAVNDPGAHNPDRLIEPRPESRFLDDGRYHGAWQDWQLGVSHHAHLAGFGVRSHAVLTWPSHDYTFFASAAVGQRLKRLRIGADASRRLARSNFHYSLGYSYEFVEKVMGENLDKHHYRLSGRYDFSPEWSAVAFVNARRGNGLEPADFFGQPIVTERWYQHDRLLRHNFTLGGVGATWRFDDRWSASLSTARLIRGDSMHRIRYAHDLQIARDF